MKQYNFQSSTPQRQPLLAAVDPAEDSKVVWCHIKGCAARRGLRHRGTPAGTHCAPQSAKSTPAAQGVGE